MLDSDEDTLQFIKGLIDNSVVKKYVKTEISQDELQITCDDGTVYTLTIRSFVPDSTWK